MSNISKINLFCQKLKMCSPNFEILKKEGSDNKPKFYVSCTFEGKTELGEGFTLKEAKECASAKIVVAFDVDRKLEEWDDTNNVVYSVESYNARLQDIWNWRSFAPLEDVVEPQKGAKLPDRKSEGSAPEYILTLKKKTKKAQQDSEVEYKNFVVILRDSL